MEEILHLHTKYSCDPAPGTIEGPGTPGTLPDNWIDNGGNEGDPKEEYDESLRKPIWWYHTDHLGSSTYLTDNFGRPSHYYDNLPFGESMVEHNQSQYYGNQYKFNGKELDSTTGMYYYGARYYEPRFSIFVSVDPLVDQTMEPYLYVGNNPIMFTDPTGMSKEGGEDWVYNKSNKTYHWDSTVSKPSDIKDDNFEYVGASTNDVNKHYEKNNPVMSNFTKPSIGNDLNGAWPGEIKQYTPSFWENQSDGNLAQNMFYDFSNGFYITGQMFLGRSVGDLSMRNLDGSATTTDQGVLGFTSVGSTFLGVGKPVTDGVKYIANSKLMYQPLTKGKNGFTNFRIGFRNTKTNYQFRLERHQFNTNSGTKVHTTHLNFGTQGKKHFFLNRAKAKNIKP